MVMYVSSACLCMMTHTTPLIYYKRQLSFLAPAAYLSQWKAINGVCVFVRPCEKHVREGICAADRPPALGIHLALQDRPAVPG